MNTASADDGQLTVHLALTSSPSSPRIPLKISKDIPAGRLRSSASEATKIPLSSIKLIFRGRLIAESDRDAVAEFKLEDGCVVHCMGKPSAAPMVAEASSAAATAAPSAAPAGASVSIPSAGAPAAASPPAAAAPAAAESDPLKAALAKMKSECSPPSAYLTALQTLDKILSNIESHPMEEKYRRVKRGNAAFQRRLGGLPGGHDAMLAAGFTVEHGGEGGSREEVYKIVPSPEAWPKLLEAKGKIGAALSEAQRANTTVPAMAQPVMGAVPPAIPGMGGMGGMPPMMPGMEEAAATMLSNPESLQRMLQDPMVRSMMRNDPRFANNPQMAAQMETLMNDPNMIRQMSQMMSNPAMREQMMQMSRAAGGMGGSGLGGASPGAAPGAQQQAPTMDPAAMATQMQMLQRMMGQQGQQLGSSAPAGHPNQAQQGGAGGSGSGNDQEMTEEEMIQEAIRRSLQDGSS